MPSFSYQQVYQVKRTHIGSPKCVVRKYNSEMHEGVEAELSDSIDELINLEIKRDPSKPRVIMGFRDDHSFYDSHLTQNGNNCSGKPFVLSLSDTKTHQIFLDDHINETEGFIVDSWNKDDLTRVSFEQLNDRFIKKVNTVSAITDYGYFSRLVEQMVRNRAQSLGLACSPSWCLTP